MSEKNEGGPAFPSPYEDESYLDWVASSGPHAPPSPGMSLRDYFAAQALQSTVAETCLEFVALIRELRSGGKFDQLEGRERTEQWMEAIGRTCYDYADGMLKAREGKW